MDAKRAKTKVARERRLDRVNQKRNALTGEEETAPAAATTTATATTTSTTTPAKTESKSESKA